MLNIRFIYIFSNKVFDIYCLVLFCKYKIHVYKYNRSDKFYMRISVDEVEIEDSGAYTCNNQSIHLQVIGNK